MNTYTDVNGVRWIVAPRIGQPGLMATPDPASPKRYRFGPPGGYVAEPDPTSGRWRSISGVVDDFANANAGTVIDAGSGVPWFVWLGLAWLVLKGKR